MEFVKTSINIAGIRVDEPVTVLTDLLVAAVCFYAYYKLTKISGKQKLHYYLRYYFITMGIATFLGGVVGHGFLYALPYNQTLAVSPWKLPGWYVSMLSIALLERAVIERAKVLVSPKLGSFFSILNIVELLTFVTIVFITVNFFFVEVHSAYGLLVVTTSFSIFIYYKTKHKGSALFITGVAFSAVSALFFINHWGLHKWFNYFDISHTLMAVGAWFFYRGARYMVLNPIKSAKK